LPFEQPNGEPYRIDTDYRGAKRNAKSPFPGPFTRPDTKERQTIPVWPNRLPTE
jgi:hypothetical protein